MAPPMAESSCFSLGTARTFQILDGLCTDKLSDQQLEGLIALTTCQVRLTQIEHRGHLVCEYRVRRKHKEVI